MSWQRFLGEAEARFDRGDYTGSIALYEALRPYSADEPVLAAFLDMNVAQCRRRLGDHGQALRLLRRALPRVAGTRQLLEGQILVSLGNLLCDQASYDDALAYLLAARQVFDTHGNSRGRHQSIISLSRAFAGLGHLELSRRMLEGLPQFEQLEEEIEAQRLHNLALFDHARGEDEAAVAKLREGLLLTTAIASPYDRAGSLITLSEILLDCGQPGEARILAASADVVLQGLDIPALSLRLARLRAILDTPAD